MAAPWNTHRDYFGWHNTRNSTAQPAGTPRERGPTAEHSAGEKQNQTAKERSTQDKKLLRSRSAEQPDDQTAERHCSADGGEANGILLLLARSGVARPQSTFAAQKIKSFSCEIQPSCHGSMRAQPARGSTRGHKGGFTPATCTNQARSRAVRVLLQLLYRTARDAFSGLCRRQRTPTHPFCQRQALGTGHGNAISTHMVAFCLLAPHRQRNVAISAGGQIQRV